MNYLKSGEKKFAEAGASGAAFRSTPRPRPAPAGPAAARPAHPPARADTYGKQGKESPGHAAAAQRCPAPSGKAKAARPAAAAGSLRPARARLLPCW